MHDIERYAKIEKDVVIKTVLEKKQRQTDVWTGGSKKE